jgi:hypothetical protein
MVDEQAGATPQGQPYNDIPYGNYTLQPGQLPLQIRTATDADSKPHVTWVCPMCGGPVQAQELREPIVIGLMRVEPPKLKSFFVSCDCGMSHAGSADGTTGCGFSFMLPLEVATGRVAPPQPVGNDLLPWAAQMNAKDLSALSDLRSSASSWAGSLATALGAVSLSAILTGSKTFSGLASTPAHWGEVFFILAGVMALIATGLALYTAQQTSLSPYGADPKRYRDWATRPVEQGIERLHWSQVLAVAAVAAALASAGILFFGPQAASTPTRIDVSGTKLCQAGSSTTTAPPAGTGFVLECGK